MQIRAHLHLHIVSTPKGIVHAVNLTISQTNFRYAISSTCQTAVSEITSSCIGVAFAEIVVAVGSIDLVVGELDR